jgi:hypothetical protein
MHRNRQADFLRPLPLQQRARQRTALALMTTAALALSTVIAATAISIGIAKADVLGGSGSHDGHLAVAVLLGVVFAGMGALTALLARPHSGKPGEG